MKLCIVGLGYVGLPLALEFSKHFKVIGFDISSKRIQELKSGIDRNEETENNIKDCSIDFTDDEKRIAEADYVIIAVPTPIDEKNEPDLSLIERATETVGKNLKKGSVVIYESTVYPGVTEEICKPLLEQYSKMNCGTDFKIGYSPERMNPGDKEHSIDKIVKVVSGSDNDAAEKIANLYSKIVSAGIHKAKNIKTAEAAKVIENIQRDLNIALMNELSLIFERNGLDTKDVIEAAATKWNFHKYTPGLVGGHCIGVDPYYLTYRAKQLGYKPEIILAGRAINEHMSKHVANIIINELKNSKNPKESTVLIMGLTFKENVKDTRNSKVLDVINHLKDAGINVLVCEPLLDERSFEILGMKNTKFSDVGKVDCIAILVPHNQFRELTLSDIRNKTDFLVDIKNMFDKEEAENLGLIYRSL